MRPPSLFFLHICALPLSLWTQSLFALSPLINNPQQVLSTSSPLHHDCIAPSNDTSTRINPEDIGSADRIEGLRLSKDGARVVYAVGPSYNSGEHSTSALWLADTFVEESARQITSGAYHDHSPSFHPTSSKIFFLSDRFVPGGLNNLYSLSISASEEEDVRITDLEDDRGIVSYSISPDGNFIAFTLETKKVKKGEKEPIIVWRQDEIYVTLHLMDLRAPYHMRTLVSTDAHVDSFSWSPDSSAIVYRLLSHRDFESRSFPVEERIISVSGEASDTFTYTRMPTGPTIWRERGDLVFVQALEPSKISSANCVWSRRPIRRASASHLAYGSTNDVDRVVDLGAKSQYVVGVAEGLITKFDVYDEHNTSFTAFRTTLEFSTGSEWDMTLTRTENISAVLGEQENLWSGVTEFGKEGVLSKKLSSHNPWFNSKVVPVTEPFFWTGSDGVKLEGVMTYPAGVELKRLKTVVVAHGGPSSRDTLSVNLSYGNWRLFLASHGYLVLSPNYRGSTGRGNDFALPANGGVGTIDWEDIDTMIDAGVLRGIVDPERVAIGGWSQGGFQAAWGCTRPDNKFKACVVGAGISDWGFMAASSDMPDFEAALAGSAPWTPGDPLYLKGSPIKDVKNVKAPVLILHGKEDARVPLTQAIALLRGIEREGQASIQPTLVVYPREGHGFKERAHAEDVLRRLIEYLDLYLK
ncbi:Alpha/Beta hydrolase protein [Flammula alnicola]|nr:Alpha/Beta hydrolase protein [Flammula alnicola]